MKLYLSALVVLAASGTALGQDVATQPSAPELPTITPGPELTLADALRRADARNLSLAAARVEIEKSQAQLHQAWASLLPVLGGQMVYTHNDHADAFNPVASLGSVLDGLGIALPNTPDLIIRRQEDLRGGLQASLPLISAQGWLGTSAARLGVDVAALTVANVREQLLFSVAQAYLAAVISRELVLIQEQQVRAARHHADVAEARQAAGDALRIDVVRAQTEVEQSKQDVLSAHLALDNARDALATLTASQELPLPAPLPNLPSAPTYDDSNLADAVEHRPDVQAARTAVAFHQRSLTAAWMQFIPTLGVSGQYNYLFTKAPDLGSPDRSRWAALLTLSVPLYNEFRYAELDSKRAGVKQTELRAVDLANNAELEIRKAQRDYLSALALLGTAERQASLAREAFALAEAAYANGASTSLDVTDAQRARRTAEINAATQRLHSQVALLTLLKATGYKAEDLAH
jgi:outer membrane protein TolC